MSLANLYLWFELIIPYMAKLSKGNFLVRFRLDNGYDLYGSMLVDLYRRVPFLRATSFMNGLKRKFMETIFMNLHR